MSAPAPSSVAVMGLGYVGLPLVVEAVRQGLHTVGFDISRKVIDELLAGRSHVDDISDAEIAESLERGLTVTDDPAVLGDVDAVVICVPTPLDEHHAPDLRAVEGAAAMVADRLRDGMLVVLESTSYPGTTDGPVRERLERSGLVAGVDFALAFSPERIDPGNEVYQLRNTPKIVGGLTPACTERAVQLYEQIVETVVPTTGTREAEMAKLLENTYRHVNIALVNEMAVFSRELGVDLWDAIDAARTKPFGFAPFYPGPGVGGHCIPIDPNYLSHRVRTLGYQFRFVELAQDVSSRMPAYVVRRAQDLLNEHSLAMRGSRVLVLGLTYKPDIADDRETPARPVVRGLHQLGAEVVLHDPHLRSFEIDGVDHPVADDLDAELASADLVLLLQPHQAYDLDVVAARARLVLDTRGRLRGDNVHRM